MGGVGEQVACFSLVALFSVALMLVSSQFVASRVSKPLALPAMQQMRAPL